jgi:hypothetical protein
MVTPHQQRDMRRVEADKKTLGEIARSYDVSRWTISRPAQLRGQASVVSAPCTPSLGKPTARC